VANEVTMTKVRVAGPRIDVAEAKALVETGEAVVVDAVASHVWPSMTRSIPGAIRIPPEAIPRRHAELPRDKTIIVYCT
jgi:rhodanese-related sulfurtransferase